MLTFRGLIAIIACWENDAPISAVQLNPFILCIFQEMCMHIFE